jgi:hypothetical protein
VKENMKRLIFTLDLLINTAIQLESVLVKYPIVHENNSIMKSMVHDSFPGRSKLVCGRWVASIQIMSH